MMESEICTPRLEILPWPLRRVLLNDTFTISYIISAKITKTSNLNLRIPIQYFSPTDIALPVLRADISTASEIKGVE